MSSKNKTFSPVEVVIPLTSRDKPHSLRLQLMFWYGVLVVGSLISFGVLVLWLTSDAVNKSVIDAMSTRARITKVQIERELTSNLDNPWPEKLSLTAVDVYSDPGLAAEATDFNEVSHYKSTSELPHITVTPQLRDQIRRGVTPEPYVSTVENRRVQVEVLPLNAPDSAGQKGRGDVVGMLVVAKSLEDVDKLFTFLRTLLFVAGSIVLLVALMGGWAIAATVLRPLGELVQTARTIAANVRGTNVGSLSQRVRRPRSNDEMVQVVDTFNEMLTALEGAVKAQRRFVADASHELRAPLTTIQGNLAILQRHIDGMEPDERRTMLNDAYEETLRLSRLVEELLILARADANTDQRDVSSGESSVKARAYQKTSVELDHTLLQLVRQLRGRLNFEGSKITLSVGHIEPVRVLGDDEMLRRVMLILLDNAIKYTTPVGEEQGRVTVSLEKVQAEAVLRVQDNGIGIDAVDLPHIFERFYRADRARSRQGVGLGLSIAQTLVSSLGGRITADSKPGEGSTFSVWLPLA